METMAWNDEKIDTRPPLEETMEEGFAQLSERFDALNRKIKVGGCLIAVLIVLWVAALDILVARG